MGEPRQVPPVKTPAIALETEVNTTSDDCIRSKVSPAYSPIALNRLLVI
jgi:hypothetical protein